MANHPKGAIQALILCTLATTPLTLPTLGFGQQTDESGANSAFSSAPSGNEPVSQAVYQSMLNRSRPAEGWFDLPESAAQCTSGAIQQGHHAKVRILPFNKTSTLKIIPLTEPRKNAVQAARASNPTALYIGNGPIFMSDGRSGGYTKVGKTVHSPLDCVNYKSSTENLGKQNSVFVRYHPRVLRTEIDPNTGESREVPYLLTTWKYRVIETEALCLQLQPKAYVDSLVPKWGLGTEAYLKRAKRWEKDREDLIEATQIDFAIQSGPAVLRDGDELLADWNGASDHRSYIGVDESGQPLVVEAEGKIGAFCLGRYLKEKRKVRDLLHRDSIISDASFREPDGRVTGYPTANPDARAASLFVISP